MREKLANKYFDLIINEYQAFNRYKASEHIFSSFIQK